MMARLLDDDASRVDPGLAEFSKPQQAPTRKLSFKTRPTSAASRSNYRAAKVSLTSTNVAHITSKFNTIVINDGPQSRALLRKLSSNQRKNNVKEAKRKSKVNGVVKAAVEKFENQESNKINHPSSCLNRGSDFRPKLVVVRKSSSKSSTKSEDSSIESSKKLDILPEKSTKHNKLELKASHKNKAEIKRKPSLKEKPNLKHTNVVKYDKGTSLNQRMAEFNNTEPLRERKNDENSTETNLTTKLKCGLINDRIAQFNKCREQCNVDHRKTRDAKTDKKLLPSLLKGNVKQQEPKKSILKTSVFKQPNITYESKSYSIKINEQNNTEHTNNVINSQKMDGTICSEKTQILGEDNNELAVFHNMPDIVTSAKIKGQDISYTHHFCVGYQVSKCDHSNSKQDDNGNAEITQSSQDSTNQTNNTLKLLLDAYPKSSSQDYQENNTNIHPLSTGDTTKKHTPPKTVSPPILKSSMKPYLLDSPIPTPIDLSKIKPNNSFLWKSATRIGSEIREVPIYDDSLQIEINNTSVDDKDTNNHHSPEYETVHETNHIPNVSNINLDITNSFILEMTEQIDKRFTNGSIKEDNSDDGSLKPTIQEKIETIPKNVSFLHCKSDIPKITPNVTKNQKVDLILNTKPDLVNIVKAATLDRTSTIFKDSDSPPKLPAKPPRATSTRDGHPSAPPVPPPHTKPKKTSNMLDIVSDSKPIISDEEWLNNCKKILELPPPLRKQRRVTSVIDKTSVKDQNGTVERRFSVSQAELVKRRSEMNLDKWSYSLPQDSFNHISSGNSDEENHYSSIPQHKETDDLDSYEIIEENNYAEITERMEDGNIYQDISNPDQEDYYEAINNVMVQQADSDSSCDQSNSLYGLTKPASGSAYQVSGGSETSDEWVDLENSDDQQESVLIYRENERGRGLGATESWSIKVRRQWSRQAADGIDESAKTGTDVHANSDDGDDTSYCDDFDDSLSDSSFDSVPAAPVQHEQIYEEKRSQPIAEGIYGLMKQAGKSMRKHWTFGKSLARMGKNKSTSNIVAPANLDQRAWSFKSKDKPLAAQSTFYLQNVGTLNRLATKSTAEPKVDPRRLSTASSVARPSAPPPPPPPRNSIDGSTKKQSNTYNYNSSADNSSYIEGQRRISRNGNANSMWYVDNSNDSASEHGSSHGSDLNLKFADEPLYQFYADDIAKMTMSAVDEEAEDGYEEITPPTPAPLDLAAHHRSLWCEVPQVVNSRILGTLTLTQRRLQEAKFEVMTSEASYFKSLTVLDKVFASCPLFSDDHILSRNDRKALFGNVHSVRKSSEKLLVGLQKCWQNCMLLQGICEVVYTHVQADRDMYVRYCTNQISMDHTLKRIKQNNSNFSTVLTQLETDPDCQSLTLYSFLMLPMQRITRLRLLFETMFTLLDSEHAEYSACQNTLEILNRVVMDCNEGARNQERLEEMIRLSKQLEFPPEMVVPLWGEGESRWLVRSGPVTQVNMDAKQTFGRRLSRNGPKFFFFLLTDLLIVTKKKSEESYLVVDHCQRNLLDTEELNDFPGNNRYLLELTLLVNTENKTVVMTLSCDSETERQRWLQVLRAPQSEDPEETLYEGWDCPQVSVVHAYQPTQPDELLLSLGDIINVLRKSEGWYYGERTRDGVKGWFPGNYTREIASKHTRARNIKKRHRLLQLSADFVLQQRKSKS